MKRILFYPVESPGEADRMKDRTNQSEADPTEDAAKDRHKPSQARGTPSRVLQQAGILRGVEAVSDPEKLLADPDSLRSVGAV